MNEKENAFPLHPTVLEWRICPAGCQETASSFDFRRFSEAEFSQRISSPHVRFLSPHGTRVQEPTRARVRWSWLASSWLVVLPLIVCSFYFGCRFCQFTTSSTRDVAHSMEEIVLWFWHLLNRVFSKSFSVAFCVLRFCLVATVSVN